MMISFILLCRRLCISHYKPSAFVHTKYCEVGATGGKEEKAALLHSPI